MSAGPNATALEVLAKLPRAFQQQLETALAQSQTPDLTMMLKLASSGDGSQGGPPLPTAQALNQAIATLQPERARWALQAMLAQRTALPARPEVVWTGPPTHEQRERRTEQVLEDLFRLAKHEVLIVAYRFTDRELREQVAPLVQRDISVRLFLDWDRYGPGTQTISAVTLAEARSRVVGLVGEPTVRHPKFEVYIDARMLKPGHRASLHAKAVVADRTHSLVTSANLTDHGMDVNTELGVLLHEPTLAQHLCTLFEGLVTRGVFVRVPRH